MDIQTLGIGTKWISTAAGIWIQCVAGSSYTFSIYSSALKSTQGYDQSTLDTVSVFKDVGANAGILSGLLYSAVSPTRRRRSSIASFFSGPWVVHLAGVIQCFVGYLFMYAAVAGMINRPPVPAMCLFMFLAAHAQTFFNTADVVSGVENFPEYSGTIVGIMKGFLGLSGAIIIRVYDIFCNGEASTYLLMLALLPTCLTLLLMFLIQIDKSKTGEEKKYLNYFSAIALVIAAYLMIIIILDIIVNFPQWASILTFVFLILLLASPLGISIQALRESLEKISPQSPLLGTSDPTTSSEPYEYNELPNREVEFEEEEEEEEEDTDLLKAMGTINFWLLFLAMICGMGSGLATINNMSQIGESLGYGALEITTFVSLWSIWNFLGRFGAGYLSDFLLHSRCWARPLLMAITQLTMSIGHIIIASGYSGNLYLGSTLVGICYGSQWSLMPTITSEIFGVRHMGTIFNTIAIASPVGSYIFSVRVIGYIYDKEATGEDNSCSGTHCFMLSFFIMAGVAFFGFLVALVLFFRTRRFYKEVVLRRIKRSLRR